MYKNYINKPDVLNQYVYKILLIMRLTTVILIISMLQVSASTLAQNFSYVKKKVPIAQVFKEVRKQTGVNILWNEREMDANALIDANFKKSSIEEVLRVCLSQLPVSYIIKDKMVFIKPRTAESSIGDKIAAFFSAIEVRGRVVDENNLPLAGATVKVKGTATSTITDNKGEFVLKGVDEKAILIISYLGYELQEIKAQQNLGTIQLTENSDRLQEVQINAGYYKVNEREKTGSISKITASTIAQQPINNPILALQNRVPGLQITQQTGVAGGAVSVQIRGRNSISIINEEPLYIIDGVVYPSAKLNSNNSNAIYNGSANPLSMINPNDIESIEVLKDADATAIYGSRGSSGVILITTKKANSGEIRITANVLQGVSEVGKLLKLMNTEEYLNMRRDAFKNDGLNPAPTDYDVNGVWDANRYIDWQDELIGGTANTTNASLNVSGGSSKARYLFIGNYYREGSVFPGNFGFKRGGIHSNASFGSTETRLSADVTLNYSHATNNLLLSDPTSNIFRAPNAPSPYDEFGKLKWYENNVAVVINPMATLLQTQDAYTNTLVGNTNITYRILNHLSLKASLGYTFSKREELDKLPNEARSPSTNPTSANRSSRFGNNSSNSLIAETQLNYFTRIGTGKLDVLAGLSYQNNETSYRSVIASNFNADELMSNISSASVFSIGQSNYTMYKYFGAFARINYSIASKYYLNLTGRRDGSSRFGPGKQFANFGAIGAGWIFSDENYIKKQFSFLSFGKLRASYGITGNDQIGDYRYMQLYNTAPSYQGTPTLITSRIANPDFSWENNKKAEAALEVRLLKDMISFQLSYYLNRSSNQIVSVSLPLSIGPGGLSANFPATVENKGLEFEGSIKLIKKENWEWTTGINITVPKNKLVSYPGIETSVNSTTLIVGKPLSISRYYNTYVDPQTGLYAFEDTDGNGLMNDADRYLNKFIGQIFYGGFQNAIRYKRFNIDFLFSFTKQNGNSMLSGITSLPGAFSVGSPSNNKPASVANNWKNPSDVNEIPKFSTTSNGLTNLIIGTISGSQSISDNSFVKLKNVSLAYSFSNRLIPGVKHCSVFLQGQNLFTLSNYEGIDPENQTIGRLPPLRNISLGLQLTL